MTDHPSTPPFALDRFVTAQAPVFDQAIRELRGGRKQSHWMWFVFPQVAGLGHSSTARFYAISGLDEAKAYLRHPILGPRLIEASEAILAAPAERSAREILGSPDDLKLRSSATLFAAASAENSVFERVLDRFYDGQPDGATVSLLELRPRGSGGMSGV